MISQLVLSQNVCDADYMARDPLLLPALLILLFLFIYRQVLVVVVVVDDGVDCAGRGVLDGALDTADAGDDGVGDWRGGGETVRIPVTAPTCVCLFCRWDEDDVAVLGSARNEACGWWVWKVLLVSCSSMFGNV